MFPLFISLAALSIWGSTDSLIALTISLLFTFLFFYTFFYTQYEKYVDTEKKKIIKNFKWLWVKFHEEESLTQYESVCICLGPSLPNSNWQSITVSYTYDVALIRKYTSRTSLLGYGGFENFPLKVVINNPQEAKEYAISVSKMLNIDVAVDTAVTKLLKYDLLQYGKEF